MEELIFGIFGVTFSSMLITKVVLTVKKTRKYNQQVSKNMEKYSINDTYIDNDITLGKAIQNLNNKDKIISEDYSKPKLTKQPVGEIRTYYLDGEFEKKSDEVLSRDLPDEKGQTLVKKRSYRRQ